ncbi:hypothetical protein Tco_1362771 [Tanacetum coccineum]
MLRWVLLLQEFYITISDKKGSENLMADHLSKIENPHKDVLENKDINEHFPLETLGVISSESTPWFADYWYGYIINHKKTVKNGQARTRERKSAQKPEAKPRKSQSSVKKSKKSQLMVNRSQPQEDKTQNDPNNSLNFSKDTKIVPGPEWASKA